MAKTTITFETDPEDYFPEYFLFHVPSREMWDMLLKIFSEEDINLTPCEDKLFYYEVDVNEQKR